jgi:hypothetical protein
MATTLGSQLLLLIVLAIPIASISWTVTHEDVFRELRQWLIKRGESSRYLLQRKFFLVLTCEYCFSHYVTLVFLLIFRFTLAYSGWRGYLVAGFSLVWLANVYMSLFGRLRLEIRHERQEIAQGEAGLEEEDT